jgi:hypothetical protein
MAVGLHVLEDFGDLAFTIDNERGARDPFHLLAVHVLFLDHAESFADLFVGVGEQVVRKLVFFFKFLLRSWSVGGNPQNGESGFLQFCICVAEPARFYGSTGSVGLGIEEEDDVLPAQVFQAYDRTVLV